MKYILRVHFKFISRDYYTRLSKIRKNPLFVLFFFFLLLLSFLHQLHLLTLEFVKKKLVPNLLIFVLMLNGGGTCIYTSRTRKQKTEGLIDGTGGTCIPVNRLNADLVDSVPRTLLNSPVFTIILLYIARSITLRFFSSKYQWCKNQMWHEWHCSRFLIETKWHRI